MSKLTLLHHIDIDHFKDLNDRRSHAYGDKVLQVLAERLQESLREGDLAARIAGDEFLIAQFGLSSEVEVAASTLKILELLKHPILIEGSNLNLTFSVGTAVADGDSTLAEQLITSSNTALYDVKSSGRNGHCYFEPQLDEKKRKRIALESLLRDAVENNAFELHFQPLYNTKERCLTGFEALIRLSDKSGKPISPAEFIPIAEEIGLIDQIGSWVLINACEVAAYWPLDLQISVNLSVAQFRTRSVVEATRNALKESGLAPERLLLEITEGLLMAETESVLDQLAQLKNMGASIVMDDFGTGYSSLGYMLKFPFDKVKIDRSFVQRLDNLKSSDSARVLVQTIIALSHTLKMNVTAEGVETATQADILSELGCDDVQGYYFGKPMPSEDVSSHILRNYQHQLPGATVLGTTAPILNANAG